MGSASQSNFSLPKALASLAHLIKQTQESLYPVMKMIYLAEKCHLERYGRLITGDTYIAMNQGPVPSSIYDMVKFVRGERAYYEGGEAAKALLSYDLSTHQLSLLSEPDLSELSQSDIECLNEVVAKHKGVGGAEIRKMSHDDAWRATSPNSGMSLATIAAQFDDGAVLTQHLADRYPGTAH